MKKIFVLVFGLMSLITYSSCEDSFSYYDDNSFMPYGYIAKSPKIDDSTQQTEVTTLQIQGLRELIFDEIEKTDWRIITPAEFTQKGNVPLEILENTYILISDPKEIMEISTSYGNIPVVFGNTTVTYEYLGQQVELFPIEGLHLIIKIQESARYTEPCFTQYGYIVYTLCVGSIPVKVHKQQFIVIDSDKIIDFDPEDEGENGTAG